MGVLLCFYCQVEKLTGLPHAKPVDDINIYMFVPNQGDLKPSEIGNSRMIETALGEEAQKGPGIDYEVKVDEANKKVSEVNNKEVKKDEKKEEGEDKTKEEANEDSTDDGKGQTKEGKEEVNDGNKKE